MPDQITGVVVLQKLPEQGLFGLWFQYVRHDGIIGWFYIPIKDKADLKPPAHTGPLWNFVRRNPVLECSPSVRILGPYDGAPDHFHNTAKWTNHYVEMADSYAQEPDDRPSASEVCREINRPETTADQINILPSKETQDERILAYRAKGVLL